MIVHLAGSLREYTDDIANLKKIVDIIHDHSDTLSHNWIDPAIIRHKNGTHVDDWTDFVKGTMDALRRSDVVIIEATHYTFSQGFQLAAALDYKKPVLVVAKESFQYKYITGFTNSLLSYTDYSSTDELAQKVTSFLKKNTIHTKDMRFNFFITRKLAKYLEETSRETGRNRSEIIRDLIKKSSQQKERR